MALNKNVLYFGILAVLFILVGFVQSWNVSLSILNLCLISGIMALGVNVQWGYAGLFNVGVMGSAALGGLAAVLIGMPPVQEAWAAAGYGPLITVLLILATLAATIAAFMLLSKGRIRTYVVTAIVLIGIILIVMYFDPVSKRIEGVNPASTGYLGGLGLPVLIAWPVGGLFAGAAAYLIGKVTLGLRSDYLAIATLGISEIIIAVLKHEDWMSRGVKNVIGIPRPVPRETDLQVADWFISLTNTLGMDVVTASSIYVKLLYAILFLVVLLIIMWFAQRASFSPWGRMMRAIRDNEVSANAMGKNITARHLQVFVIGSIIVGIAGAMLTTLEGQLTPSSYQPLRFTFLIWVMVIVGGSGNNWGSVLGGFVIWFLWVEAAPVGVWLMGVLTSGLSDESGVKQHLLNQAGQMRLVTMGAVLLIVMRFRPNGLLPERS